MEQESDSSQASSTAFHKSTMVYDALEHLILTHETAFLNATGVSVQLVPNGDSIVHLRRKGNAFCRLMAQFDDICSACQEVHKELQRMVADSLAPQTIYCFAGLAEFAVPVVINEQHVATLIGGQVFHHKPTEEQFARLALRLRDWGLYNELGRFKTRFFQTHVISLKRFQASVQLLQSFTSLLADDINHNVLKMRGHDHPCVTTAQNFILAHASEPLRLQHAAEHVHLSTQYFCKFFKKATGMGFSEFLGRARVENAKQALANSVLPISEVAEQAGFGSLSQFNRTFHRYVGCSPKEYRASLRSASSF